MVDVSLSCTRTFDSALSNTTVWLMYRYPGHGLLTRRCPGQRYGFDVSLSCARTFDSALSGMYNGMVDVSLSCTGTFDSPLSRTTVWLIYRYPVQGLLTLCCPGQQYG